MKKLLCILLSATLFACAVAVSVSADEETADVAKTVPIIEFSTNGTDYYADGSTVTDNEWYALCWSENAVFGGLDKNCEPLVEGDKFIYMAPLAKNGHCPKTYMMSNLGFPDFGNYFVVMLDTRVVKGGKTIVSPCSKQSLFPLYFISGVNSTSFEVNKLEAEKQKNPKATLKELRGLMSDGSIKQSSSVKLPNSEYMVSFSGLKAGEDYMLVCANSDKSNNAMKFSVPDNTTKNEQINFIIDNGKNANAFFLVPCEQYESIAPGSVISTGSITVLCIGFMLMAGCIAFLIISKKRRSKIYRIYR